MNTNESSWKPSDGQLECLEYAINNAEKDYSPLAGNRIYLTLKALKKQLEKIKNENIVMEDYKEKYNKLVEAIKVLQEANPSNKGIQNWINAKVPELAESEDEKIRKDLISLLNSSINGKKVFSINDTTRKQMIAWLEKQGEQKQQDKEYTFKSIPRLLDMIEPSKKAKFYCQKLIDTLKEEGYNTDAKIVGDCLKNDEWGESWNGDNG